MRPRESADFDQTLHSPHIYAEHQITGGKIVAETQHISRYPYRSISEIYRDIDINIDYRNSTSYT